ncbi:MAG: hypothetical protein JW940_18720 [Polyangiaceae bacterium]|nr:hypothetical protein [Polyangiaceae bacterium]
MVGLVRLVAIGTVAALAGCSWGGDDDKPDARTAPGISSLTVTSRSGAVETTRTMRTGTPGGLRVACLETGGGFAHCTIKDGVRRIRCSHVRLSEIEAMSAPHREISLIC